ncbi:MAG: hypothetical protein N4A41_05420, partial [Crocinitomicaceae bacterium]|nr:hypothetical protein [Crocinitomicaceae bacterium]
IMRSNPGDILEDPLVGVGIHNFLNSSLSRNQRENFIREVRLQLEADGAKGVKVKFEKEITVEGRYE